MEISEYKQICSNALEHIPYEPGVMQNYLILALLHKLYNMTTEGTEAERAANFKHWLSLPIDEVFKREVLDNVRERSRR